MGCFVFRSIKLATGNNDLHFNRYCTRAVALDRSAMPLLAVIHSGVCSQAYHLSGAFDRAIAFFIACIRDNDFLECNGSLVVAHSIAPPDFLCVRDGLPWGSS
jgi:hypothetical protein